MKIRWFVLGFVLILALVTIVAHHTADYTARSLQRISDIAADVYASYFVIGIKFETTDRQRQSCEGIANRPSRMAEKEI